MSLTKNRDRLSPTFHTGDVFATALEERGVPVEGLTATGRRIAMVNHPAWSKPVALVVPRVCGEIYRQWISPRGQFSSLKLATVADMARDAYVAEGGRLQLTGRETLDKRFTKFGVAAK